MLSARINYISSYQKLLDRIADIAWIMDESGQIYSVNIAWKNYTGQSDLVYLWEQIREERQVKSLCQDCSVSTGKGTVRLKNAAGEYKLFNFELERLTSEESSLWLGTASLAQQNLPNYHALNIGESELADYKQKERELQRNVEFVRRIMESSQDCIKVLDLQGRLLYMNDGGQEIMEIDDFTQVQNSPWLGFWQGCDREAAERAFNVAKTGKIGKFDGHCATAKGTPKWWEVVVTPMIDESGGVREILSVSRDITARKTAEMDLQRRNQELDRFSYVVSHDLKAPLRGVSNISQWLLEDLGDRLPPENQQQLELLERRVKRMSGLIDGLLKLSRVGRQQLPVELVDTKALLPEIVDSLSPNAGFTIDGSKLPVIHTKKLLLSQVLTNLIGNAIKHHDRETGQIEVTARDCGSYYQFAIADDGPGIEVSERKRVFEIFQTIEKSSSTTNTGIGLALVQKIVREEGGELWLEDNEPRGSRFCFTWFKTKPDI